ncbi:GNAT family N-acetyltransferase [Oceanotoga sp. DSM 15011]|jgi:predicted GNAT family N-acyltransferase|uniref:GNAT family N-acetyltransferase n=1 Tax=Oceanotoga sp. DSM 15011 TaxID=2984951 RepID=UPI0021F420A1|nr:GNAT family N-acetyltransferase [Oceanotoga sp. DSM 15011]UYP00748.1 GNAT family N-acetyltransferase [Oceanotoga sp. DSM 15011]
MNISIFSFLFKDVDFFKMAYDIRKKVFIEEQNVPPNLELDGLDAGCIHYVLIHDENPVCTARVRYLNGSEVKLERVATIYEFRKKGLGKELINYIESDLLKRKVKKITLNSQLSAKKFYEKLGYKSISEIFLEAGIEHLKMEKYL